MRYELIFSPEAIDDLRALKANARATVLDAIEQCLRFEPEKESKSRIKHLRGLSKPQFRLRVAEFRVYYDVKTDRVNILAVVSKDESNSWLEREGVKK